MRLTATKTTRENKKITKAFDVSYVHPYYLLSEIMYGTASANPPHILTEAEYSRLEGGEEIDWENGSTLKSADVVACHYCGSRHWWYEPDRRTSCCQAL